MKSKAFFCVLVILALCSNFILAQNPIKKDVYKLGGSISLFFNSHDDKYAADNNTSIDISPSLGYFVTNNIMLSGNVGLTISENESSLKNGPTFKSTYRFLNVGLGMRYYFDSEKIIPFLGISATYSKRINTSLEGNGISFIGGINYFLSREVAFEPAVMYSFSSYNDFNQKNKELRFSIGINYYLTN